MEANRIVRTREAAVLTGLAESTLEKARLRGDGPPFVRLTKRAIGYRVADLIAWVESRTASSTSEPRESA